MMHFLSSEEGQNRDRTIAYMFALRATVNVNVCLLLCVTHRIFFVPASVNVCYGDDKDSLIYCTHVPCSPVFASHYNRLIIPYPYSYTTKCDFKPTGITYRYICTAIL